jgi:hypothetical protein
VKKERPSDLDIAIAEKVMGWEWWKSSATGRRGIFAPNAIPRFTDEWFTVRADGTEELCMDWGYSLPAYSTEIAAAWLVMDKLIELNPTTFLEYSRELKLWNCNTRLAETAMKAICEAALLAGEEKK